jgi:hypothetical protein
MKKILLIIILISCIDISARGQSLPSIQFGLKAGVNLTGLTIQATPSLTVDDQAGYIAGVWARFGAADFHFQPELYFTNKNVNVTTDGATTKAKFTSIDMPLLFGWKAGVLGVGDVRVYTGPLLSFAINKDQSFSGALDKAVSLDYQDQNFAWLFGGGLDFRNLSFDLRYEAGITKQSYGTTETRVNIFSVSVAYRLVKL